VLNIKEDLVGDLEWGKCRVKKGSDVSKKYMAVVEVF